MGGDAPGKKGLYRGTVHGAGGSGGDRGRSDGRPDVMPCPLKLDGPGLLSSAKNKSRAHI